MAVKTKKKAKPVTRRRRGPAPNKPMTATEIARHISEEAGISQTDVKHVLYEFEALIQSQLMAGKKFKIGSIVQLEPKIRNARKARMGRNPATGEPVKIAAKPADVVLRARPLTGAKGSIPSIGKLRKLLEA